MLTSSQDIFRAIEPSLARLMAEHQERREHWYHHEIVPWELGRSFVDEPWDESQATLRPEVRTALQVNLLTEDNLPYYHAMLATSFGKGSTMEAWTRLWTAEEGQHSLALRSYLLVSRNCDPRQLEDERMHVVQRGWATQLQDPVDLFVYTSAQELATRISHRNAGFLADDEVAALVMKRIAADENHHFIFYKGAVSAMLQQDPSRVVIAMWRTLRDFEMPGSTIPQFVRRSLSMARLGIYNLRIHSENVVGPLLREWEIANLTDLSPEAEKARDDLMQHPADLIQAAERFEARLTKPGIASRFASA